MIIVGYLLFSFFPRATQRLDFEQCVHGLSIHLVAVVFNVFVVMSGERTACGGDQRGKGVSFVSVGKEGKLKTKRMAEIQRVLIYFHWRKEETTSSKQNGVKHYSYKALAFCVLWTITSTHPVTNPHKSPLCVIGAPNGTGRPFTTASLKPCVFW